MIRTLSRQEIDTAITLAVNDLLNQTTTPVRVLYGIPRGGMSVAYRIALEIAQRGDWPIPIVEPAIKTSMTAPSESLVIDDIVDTGKTISEYQGWRTLALVVRDLRKVKADFNGINLNGSNDWIRFPWDEASGNPDDAVARILEYLGYDPTNPSLTETPRRFLSWLSEFKVDQEMPEMTTFEGITYDQMVLVKNIPFTSLCEHHLLPFSGTVAVAYIPEKSSVIGLSKIARIVEWRAKRLQVQERLTSEIMTHIKNVTHCDHVGVIVKAEHSCMSMRGPKSIGHSTITSALTGDFKDDAKTREEFLKLSEA